MKKFTEQMKEWFGEFGKEYTERNPQSVQEMNSLYLNNFGVTRTALNEEFIGAFDRSIRILEVGSSVGIQLMCLQEMGFTQLHGVEIQRYALEIAKPRTKNLNMVQGSAFDIPFEDRSFDLVFTSGVLIHIHPEDVTKALAEIYRCSKAYIWGYEYYNEVYTMVPYRGKDNLLWKTDFAKLYLQTFPDLEMVEEKRIKYLRNENADAMYLLKKTS
jgi:pseudaminic acid biosynthesis-associated methylase